MKNRRLFPSLAFCLALLVLASPVLPRAYFGGRSASGAAVTLTSRFTQPNEIYGELYGKLPLRFEANVGQSGEEVKFIARGNGYNLFLTSTEAVLALRADTSSSSARPDAVLRMNMPGTSSPPVIEGAGEAAGESNYMLGSDPAGWRTGVPY
jgi:hypothetical protein